jgi:hypothetical protein
MADKVKLVAKERFFYGGKNVEKGEEFEAGAEEVGLLTAAFRPMAEKKGNDVSPLSTKDNLPPRTKPYPTASDRAGQATGKATSTKVAKAVGAAKYERRDMTAKED